MLIECIKDYDWSEGELHMRFRGGTEYSVADDLAQSLLEQAPECFETVEVEPEKKSRTRKKAD